MTVASLDKILSFLPHLLPEGILAAGILLQVLLALLRIRQWNALRVCAILVAAVSAYLSVCRIPGGENALFSLDHWKAGWLLVIDVSAIVVLLFRFDRHIRSRGPEYLTLHLMLLFGAHLLILSSNLFMMYLGIEILSLCGYMLVSLPVLRRSISSGFKYLVFGGVSSAVMLYGISLYYGSFDTLGILQTAPDSPLGMTAVVLITFGIMFKISAAPFHLWVPDVYEGASHPVIATLAVVPKLAGFAFLVSWVPILPQGHLVIGGLAVFTLLTGNLGALRQTNMRRLMGFSAIAHTGFMLLALVGFQPMRDYLLFYAIIYALMTLGVFHLLNHFYQQYSMDTLADYAGKGRISRGKTVYLVVWMVALTGLPPTAGFTAKLLLFTGLGQSYAQTSDPFILTLIIIGILNAVISLAYYIKLPYYMIFLKTELTKMKREKILSFTNLLGTLLVFMVLLLFIKPEWLMSWVNSINFAQ